MTGKTRQRSCVGRAVAGAGILVSVIILLNLTFGVIEIPDYLPLVGNIDEAAAAGLLLGCLRYLGIDVFSPLRSPKAEEEPPIDQPSD